MNDETLAIEHSTVLKDTVPTIVVPDESKHVDSTPFDPKTGLVPTTFGQLMRVAQIFSNSKMVPPHFQGQPDNCFVALQMAYRMDLDPMTALQNIHIVSGKPGLSGALIIALINRSGSLSGPVRFRIEGKGETLSVTAFGMLKQGDEISFTVPWSMVVAEGWTKNPKYKTMPEVMMRYRAATFLARFHFPEVIIGMHSSDEWEDTTAAQETKKSSLAQHMKGAENA